MKTMRAFAAASLALAAIATAATAQDLPKPGPEHEVLKKLEGAWDATMKFGGSESKGTMIYKMDVGGLWLASSFEGDFGGAKFQGKGFDSYDAGKKKYVSVWVDSMSTTPMLMEGTYDKASKTLTMVGEGPGMDAKPAKYKSVTQIGDKAIKFAMYMGDGKEPAFTIDYTRKK